MFIVFNKQKIYSYMVAFITVIILFVIAFAMINNKTVVTSSPYGNYIKEQKIE